MSAILTDGPSRREFIKGAGGGVQPTKDWPLRLRLHLLPQRNGRFEVRLSAHAHPDGHLLASATRQGVAEDKLVGQILLVSSPPVGGDGARWWFQDLRTGGDKIAEHPARALGPILGTLHSVNEDVLKLSAQLMPVDDSELQWWVVGVVVCQCLCKPNKAVVRSFTKTLLVDDCELQW
jgi:hypothetical protein